MRNFSAVEKLIRVGRLIYSGHGTLDVLVIMSQGWLMGGSLKSERLRTGGRIEHGYWKVLGLKGIFKLRVVIKNYFCRYSPFCSYLYYLYQIDRPSS